MKNKILNILSCALIFTALISCDKNDDFIEPQENDSEILKFGPPSDKSEVTDKLPTHYGKEAKVYETIYLGTQEWIIGYWENDCVDDKPTKEVGVYKSPNYTTNAQYYEWAAVLQNTEQSTWDNYVFSKPGFHIPTHEDIQKVKAFLGGDFRKLYSKLELPLYTDHWVGHPFNKFLNSGTSYGGFWIDRDDDPNRVDGCGIVVKASGEQSTNCTYSYTNIESLGVRVILVRDR